MIKLINAGLLFLLLIGCVSQIAPFEDHIRSWEGKPIANLLEARALPHSDRGTYKGTESIKKLKNGNLLYELPYKLCPVFFEVDSKGIIVDITTEGDKDCY